MNCNNIIDTISDTYSLEWDVNDIIKILATYIDQEADTTRFRLHCITIAADDLHKLLEAKKTNKLSCSNP